MVVVGEGRERSTLASPKRSATARTEASELKGDFMSNYEQNGRSPADPTSPPTDPRLRGVKAPPPTADCLKLCRDYVWGICTSKECRYRHELEFESMRQILKFCHDYQNRTGCTRPDCTYLHCSRDEENQFLNSAVIPRVLLDRYAAMSGSSDRAEPAHSTHVYHEYVAPPPPPPAAAPPAAGPSARPLPDAVATTPAAPMGIKVSVAPLMPHVPGPLPSILRPPPPPPPTLTITSAPISQPIYTMSPPMQHTVAAGYPVTPVPPLLQSQQISPSYSLPAIFNPAVLPPPLPSAIQPGAQKRPAIHEPEAGPSKLAKVDDYPEPTCGSCVEISFRTELCAQDSKTVQRDSEASRAVYDGIVDEYYKGRAVLCSMFTPHIFLAADEYIDSSVNAPSDMYGGVSPAYSAPSFSKQWFFQLIELIMNEILTETETPSLDVLSRRTFTPAELTRLSRPQEPQGLHALLERLVASSERRDIALEPLARLGAELPSPPLTRYSSPAAYPPAFTREPASFARSPPADPLYSYRPQAPQQPPRPASYGYPSPGTGMPPAQRPAGPAPPAYQQYLSRMPHDNPYYRPYQ